MTYTPEVRCQQCDAAPYAKGQILHDGLCCECSGVHTKYPRGSAEDPAEMQAKQEGEANNA